jgi:hypothetical protein
MITLKVIVLMHCTLSSSVIFFQTCFWNVRLLGAFVSSAHTWSWILYLDHCYSILLFVLTHRQNVFEITDFFTLWIMVAVNWFYRGVVVWALPGIGKWLASPTNVIVYASMSNLREHCDPRRWDHVVLKHWTPIIQCYGNTSKTNRDFNYTTVEV